MKKRRKQRVRKHQVKRIRSVEEFIRQNSEYTDLKGQIERIWQFNQSMEERIEDLEIHLNLLTRLFTTLCVEKFGMRVGVLKRLIKRVEKEAIRDSQILHLESLYKLPFKSDKNSHHKKGPRKKDSWDDIS